MTVPVETPVEERHRRPADTEPPGSWGQVRSGLCSALTAVRTPGRARGQGGVQTPVQGPVISSLCPRLRARGEVRSGSETRRHPWNPPSRCTKTGVSAAQLDPARARPATVSVQMAGPCSMTGAPERPLLVSFAAAPRLRRVHRTCGCARWCAGGPLRCCEPRRSCRADSTERPRPHRPQRSRTAALVELGPVSWRRPERRRRDGSCAVESSFPTWSWDGTDWLVPQAELAEAPGGSGCSTGTEPPHELGAAVADAAGDEGPPS